MEKLIHVFGASGFVGSEYLRTTLNPTLSNGRDDYSVRSDHCLYFISTVDNYNIHVDSSLDIHTNLIVLMKVLDNYRKVHRYEGCFNFISSWFVYGKDSGYGFGSYGIDEKEPCDPKGFYSITKRTAEQLLISYCETFDLNYRILRLANVLGKNDKKVSAKKNALQYLLGELKENRPIDLYDNGYFYRDYIDVRDCARAIDLVVNEGEINSIYNIGNGNPVTFRNVIDYAKEKLGSTSEIRSIEQKEFHKKVQSSRSFYMDNSKLRNLGYSPKYSIYKTIDDIIS
jgi:nucleoside-diphosphate-sugar epimerase